MTKAKIFFQSLRFRIFLIINIFGIAAVFVGRAVYLTVYKNSFVSLDPDILEQSLNDLKRGSLIFSLIIVAAIIVISLLVSIQMTKPLQRLSRSINDVQGGFEEDFKPVDSYSETAKISEACSAMLKRLQILDRTQQEFVSNVSHELKTPLTSMKVLADSLVGREDVPVELYQEFMEDIGAEIDRENEIIDDLLSLVKMDQSSAQMNIAQVDVGDMLEQIVRQMTPIAQNRNIDLQLETAQPVVAGIDAVKLTLALTNLIENAIKYGKPGGWVHVFLDTDHQNFFITVADNGIGIAQEEQEQIFERFYRVDKSHSNEITGSGLGLALARNAVILHRGSITVESKAGEGTEFTVRIPINESQA